MKEMTTSVKKIIRQEYKRAMAFILTFMMLFTNVGSNVSIALAANAIPTITATFKLRGEDIREAAQEAIEGGEVFDPAFLELSTKDATLMSKYERLLGDGVVYEIYPDMDDEAAVAGTELRTFLRMEEEAADAQLTGEEEIIFLFINTLEQRVQFYADVDGYVTGGIFVDGHQVAVQTPSNAAPEETLPEETLPEATLPEETSAPETSAPEETLPEETTEAVMEEITEATPEESVEAIETSEAIEETEAVETEPVETEAVETAPVEPEAEVEEDGVDGELTVGISRNQVAIVTTPEGEATIEEETTKEATTEAATTEVATTEATTEEVVVDTSVEVLETEQESVEAETVPETTASSETDEDDYFISEDKEYYDGIELVDDVTPEDELLEEESRGGNIKGTTYNQIELGEDAYARAFKTTLNALHVDARVEGYYSVRYVIDPLGGADIINKETSVEEGSRLSFGVRPQVGYEIEEVTANGMSLEAADNASESNLESVTSYEIESMEEDLEIRVVLIETDEHPEFYETKTVGGVTITATALPGLIPEGTVLDVKELTTDLQDAVKEKIEAESDGEKEVTAVLAYDINLLYNGEKLENDWAGENNFVKIGFTGSKIRENSKEAETIQVLYADSEGATLEADNASTVSADELVLDSEGRETVDVSDGNSVGELDFEARHFSTYIVTFEKPNKGNYTLNVVQMDTAGNVISDGSVSLKLSSDDFVEDFLGRNVITAESLAAKMQLEDYRYSQMRTAKSINGGDRIYQIRSADRAFNYKNENKWKALTEDSTVYIFYKAVSTVTITGEDVVDAGDAVQLTATVTPTNQPVIWTSSNENYATVDTNGLVTGINAGTVRIRATLKNEPDIRTEKEIKVKATTISFYSNYKDGAMKFAYDGATPQYVKATNTYATYQIPTGESTFELTEGFDCVNYKFRGWTEAEDGSGKIYQPGESIDITTNMKFYAQWGEKIDGLTEVTVEITYTGSDGKSKTIAGVKGTLNPASGELTFLTHKNEQVGIWNNRNPKGGDSLYAWKIGDEEYEIGTVCTTGTYRYDKWNKQYIVNAAGCYGKALTAEFYVLKRDVTNLEDNISDTGNYFYVGTGTLDRNKLYSDFEAIDYKLEGNKNVNDYILTAPSADKISNNINLALGENENIRWYKIINTSTAWHIDGMIYEVGKYWTVRYYDDGTLAKTEYVEDGSGFDILKNAPIVKDLDAWDNQWTYADGEVVASGPASISNDINVFAKYKGRFTVTGSIDNGGNVIGSGQSVIQGEDSLEMRFTPAEGYEISGITVTKGGTTTSVSVSDKDSYTYLPQSDIRNNINVVVTTKEQKVPVQVWFYVKHDKPEPYRIIGGKLSTDPAVTALYDSEVSVGEGLPYDENQIKGYAENAIKILHQIPQYEKAVLKYSTYEVWKNDKDPAGENYVAKPGDSIRYHVVFDFAHKVTYRSGDNGTGEFIDTTPYYQSNEVEIREIDSIPEIQPNVGYEFSGWKAITEGVNLSEATFEMPDKDVVLEAQFTPRTDISYTVEYRTGSVTGERLLEDKSVSSQTMADTVTESAVTIAGYTADATSKSLTLKAEGNVIVFVYTANTDISYTVEYRAGSVTGERLLEDKSVSSQTMADTITESAVIIAGYTADEASKSLKLGAEGNVIVFVYTANTDISYKVEYREGKLDGERLVGDKLVINQTMADTVTESAVTIAGYTVDAASKSLKLEAEGNVIVFVYTANADISYTVEYRAGSVTGERLLEDKSVSSQTMADTVTESAVTIAGYTADAASKSLKLKAEGNVIVFVYTANADISYTVEYRAGSVTGERLLEDKSVSSQTMADTVTESAVTIAGYTADATSKSLKLEAEGNVIIFVYTANTDISYTVEYRAGNVTGERLLEDKSVSSQTMADTVTESAVTIAGYTADATSKSLKLEAEGNVIVFVYTANTDTSFTINYYYQADGKYSSEPQKSISSEEDEALRGTTDTTVNLNDTKFIDYLKVDAALADGRKYALDDSKDPALHVLEGTISGDGNLVLKVYFMEQFKVTYAPGEYAESGSNSYTFNNLKYGVDTPGVAKDYFKPLDGYVFAKWEPTIADTVTADATYTAQWNKRGGLNYTIHYVYEDRAGVEVDRTTETTENAFFEDVMEYDKTLTKEHTIAGETKTYTLDQIVFANPDVDTQNTVTTDPEKNVVTLHYALDILSEEKPKEDTSDTIPDKYQIVFAYESAEHGTVNGTLREVLTREKDGDVFSATNPAYPRATGVEAIPDEGYRVTKWISDNPGVKDRPILRDLTTAEYADVAEIRNTAFAADTTFTAHFHAGDETRYSVEVYYQDKGTYPSKPAKSVPVSGTTDTQVTIDPTTYADAVGYVFDATAGNVLEGIVAGNNSLVLKVYFKQQFTVTYKPGDRGSFAEEVHSGLDYNAATPAFGGSTTANGSYRFDGWDQGIVDQVTGDAVYTAQWRYTGGGGGTTGGGGGGGPRPNTPSTEGGPGDNNGPVTILPNEVPLAMAPDTGATADDLILIDDGEVPLAALPKTGNPMEASGLMLLISGMMLAAFATLSRKKEEE